MNNPGDGGVQHQPGTSRDLISSIFIRHHGFVNASIPLFAHELVDSDRIFREICPSGNVWAVSGAHPRSHLVRPNRDKALQAAKELAGLLGTDSPLKFGDEHYERMLGLAGPVVEKYPRFSPSQFDLIGDFLRHHHAAEVNRTHQQFPLMDDGVFVDDDGTYEARAVNRAVEFEQLAVTRRYDAKERVFPPFKYGSERYKGLVDLASRTATAWNMESDATLGSPLERY